MKRNLIKLALALTVLVALPAASYAQSATLMYEKFGTNAVGRSITVFNTTDSLIVDGSVVVIDTTSNVKRVGVRNYIQNNRIRCLGIAIGNIERSSRGGAGKVLLEGYHPRALVGASGVAAYTPLKYSLSVNGSFSSADTVGSVAAVVLGGQAGVFPGVRYKYKVWFFGGLRIAGATL